MTTLDRLTNSSGSDWDFSLSRVGEVTSIGIGANSAAASALAKEAVWQDIVASKELGWCVSSNAGALRDATNRRADNSSKRFHNPSCQQLDLADASSRQEISLSSLA